MCLPKRPGAGIAPAGRGLFALLVRPPCLGPANSTWQPSGADPGSEGIHGFGREAVAVSAAGTDHVDIGAGRHGRAFTAPVDEIPRDQHLPAPQVARAMPCVVVIRAGHCVPSPGRGVEPVEVVAGAAGRRTSRIWTLGMEARIAPIGLKVQGFGHLHGVDGAPLVPPSLGARTQDPVANAGRAADYGLADSQSANTVERIGRQPQIGGHDIGVEPGHGNLLARGRLACVTGRCKCMAGLEHPVPVWLAKRGAAVSSFPAHGRHRPLPCS